MDMQDNIGQDLRAFEFSSTLIHTTVVVQVCATFLFWDITIDILAAFDIVSRHLCNVYARNLDVDDGSGVSAVLMIDDPTP